VIDFFRFRPPAGLSVDLACLGVPDYSADALRRKPAAVLAYARAAGLLDRRAYKLRMRWLRQENPDIRSVVAGLPDPAFLAAAADARATIPDRAYANALLGLVSTSVEPDSSRGRLAARVQGAGTAAELRSVCAGQERASHADRRAAARILRAAEREGRLDAAEYDKRLRAADTARIRDELTQLLADLPTAADSAGWVKHHRISTADRERVLAWLADGLTQGRLSVPAYQERVFAVAGAVVYADFTAVLDGLPVLGHANTAELLPSDADRRAAIRRLDDALGDEQVSIDEYGDLEARIQSAERLSDLAAELADLERRASSAERDEAVRLLDAAREDERLSVAEHLERIERARAAKWDRQLVSLLADLRRPAAPGSRRRSRRHRVSNKDRENALQQLKQALEDGKLDLDEYDERIRAVHRARQPGDLSMLLADLVDLDELLDNTPAAPATPPAATPTPTGWFERLRALIHRIP
jgi:hypothetical protein